MRREQLHPHPTTPLAAVHELTVGIEWHGTLALHYRLRADLDALLIPAPTDAERSDELWRHTCCELFITAAGMAGYCEFNFSPGGPWAAYRFDGYRSGMRPLEITPPRIVTRIAPSQLDVQVDLALATLPLLAGSDELQCALTAVVEARSGVRSFWSLAHATAAPDFHHPDGFVLRLPLAACRP